MVDWFFSSASDVRLGLAFLFAAVATLAPLLQIVGFHVFSDQLRPYKLQPTKEEAVRFPKLVVAFLMSRLLASSAVYTFLCVGMTASDLEAWIAIQKETVPTRVTSTWQIACGLFGASTFFYFAHRAMHSRLLYKYHKVHHEFTAPCTVAILHAHSVEMSIALGMVAIPKLMFPHMHVWTWATVHMIGASHGFYEHCGHHLPVPIFQFIPWGHNVRAHDLHHQKNTGNYGAYFLFWDTVLGTRIAESTSSSRL